MGFGTITYEVPNTRYPKTCNGKPLMYAALAAQIASTTPDEFIRRYEGSIGTLTG